MKPFYLIVRTSDGNVEYASIYQENRDRVYDFEYEAPLYIKVDLDLNKWIRF